MRTTDANKLVWNILKGMPIEVFDEEEGEVWENETINFAFRDDKWVYTCCFTEQETSAQGKSITWSGGVNE